MKIVFACLLVISVSFLWAADFWIDKDYTAWTKKECESLLTKSPWVFSNTLFEAADFSTLSSGNQVVRETQVTFRFRLLSAKPIRMAFGRLQLLDKAGDTALADRMKQMIEAPPDADNRIVIQVEFSVRPPGDPALHEINSFFMNGHLAKFRDNTYLSSSKKGLVPVLEYRPPSPRQPNPVFIFPRLDEKGVPFFDGSEKWMSFRTEILTYKIYAQNPVAKMKFRGAFEL